MNSFDTDLLFCATVAAKNNCREPVLRGPEFDQECCCRVAGNHTEPDDEVVLKDIANKLDQNHFFTADLRKALTDLLENQLQHSKDRKQTAQAVLDRLTQCCDRYKFQLLNVTQRLVVYKIGKTEVGIPELVSIAIAFMPDQPIRRHTKTSQKRSRPK